MSEKQPKSPESKSPVENIKPTSPEHQAGQEADSERLKPKEEAERSARKELDELHEAKEQEPALELINDEDRADQQVRITKEDKQRAYTHTLRHVQSKLSKPSKTFSRVIHNKAVERASEAMEKTIARPSAVLGGALFATAGLAIMLFFARRYGFALSGTELTMFIAAGWLFGLVSEFVWRKIIKRS